MAQRKETVVDLAKFIDKGVHVKLSGGREGACPGARVGLLSARLRWKPLRHVLTRVCCGAVTGNLKGYDQLLNLVLDDTLEYLRGALRCAARAHAATPFSRHCAPAVQTLRTRCA